jgi:hypothetical protein
VQVERSSAESWLREENMRKGVKAAVAGTLCGTVMITVLPAEVWAGPMSVASPSSVSLSTPVDQVRYRHRHYYGYYPRRYRYGYDPGAAMFAGAALGLMGAGIAAATAPRYYDYGWGGGYYPGYYGGGYYPGYYGGW